MAKKRFSSIILAISFLLISQSNVFAEKQPANESWIIGFEDELNLSVFDGIPHEVHHIYDTIQAVSISFSSIYIEEIRNHPEIEWVDQDQKVRINAQVEDWGYTTTVKSETKNLSLTGEGVKIGIIDTGVYTQHEDLSIAGGVSFVGSSYEDDNGHGTHVAGIIGAQNNDIGVLGLAPNAEIYAIKSLDDTGDGYIKDVLAGVNWAIENEMDIINLSLTTAKPTPALEKAIKQATEQGILFVASSGNDETGEGQTEEDILYPARYPEVIGVGAINQELLQSTFSFVGPSISLSAPGEEIYSTYLPVEEDPNAYVKMSGTSMAAPYVTGVLALYLELYPYLETEELKGILQNNIMDIGEPGKDSIYGYGLLLAPEVPFRDMRSDAWYSMYVNSLIQEDYVNGFLDGTFRPDAYITRGEVVTLVGRALELDGTSQETIFPDVSESHYASGYIASAVNREIITGFPDQTFKPSATISRGEVAVMMKRAFQIADTEKHLFNDVPEKKYYAKAINALVEQHVITGYPDQTFKPDQNINRAEFSSILAKALDETLR